MDLTIDQWISLGTLILTFATTLIILFTLFEMSRQRKNSYKPHIVIPKQFIYAKTKKDPFSDIWSLNSLKDISSKKLEKIKDYTISLYNLGLGPAKNIEMTWKFDEDIIKKIKKISKKNDMLLVINKNFISVESEKRNIYHAVNRNLEDHRDYLLPSNISKEGLECQIPLSYKALMSLYIHLSWRDDDALSNLNMFPLYLAIYYEDISGKKYVQKFSFEIEIIFIDKSEFDAMFSSKSIN